LVHVHPDGIVQNLEAAVVLFLWLRGLGTLDLGVVYDLHIEAPKLRVKLIQILGRESLRKNVVDVVVGDVAMLVGQVEQGLNCLV